MHDVIKREISAGKRPMALAASVIYLSAMDTAENKTQRDIAQAAVPGTLENLQTNYTYKVRLIHGLLDLLQHDDQNVSLAIRAANAISVLVSMSHDRRIESHIRTMLWQVVSNLEAIRE
jgi:transcription initiation factor TFIIIB Brf1 subunit/transcription initiation factor TFIIB